MSQDAAAIATAVLPWQQAALQELQRLERAARLPQTMVLQAARGTGLEYFAQALTGWLLCQQRTDTPCGQCSGCRQWRAGNHPDALRILPEGAAQEITVDQVRAVTELLSLSRHHQGYRVVQLYPAERLNRNAANALLKTLEEPGEGTVFLLLSEQPRNLLPTIRSRAQVITVPRPSEAQAREWLMTQGISDADSRLAIYPGQPLRALEDEDREIATEFEAELQQLEAAPSELTNVARRIASTRDDATRFLEWLATHAWSDAASHLEAGPSVGTTCAVETYQLTLQARGALRANTPPQLAVEALLVSWLALRAQSRKRPNGDMHGGSR
ncbi:DNA polymerase III subunit delta' [Algiphilus sp.]|uniref:DNA polymerase III subunit delta' n=1 Tax=Algiphilus sp. TaxID=1872431 RepID=UPI003B525355